MTSPDLSVERTRRVEPRRAAPARSLTWCLYLGAVLVPVLLGVLWCGTSPSVAVVSMVGLLAAAACPLGIALLVLIGMRAARASTSNPSKSAAPVTTRRDA